MFSALLDGLSALDGAQVILSWFADGLFWVFSPARRAAVRARWVERGRLYKYGQVLSWWFVLFLAVLLVLFILAAFIVR